MTEYYVFKNTMITKKKKKKRKKQCSQLGSISHGAGVRKASDQQHAELTFVLPVPGAVMLTVCVFHTMQDQNNGDQL